MTVNVYLSEAVNHRFTILCPPAIAILYYPTTRRNDRPPWYQWAVAGTLPLLHPAILPASVVFVLAEFSRAARKRRSPVTLISAFLFVMGVGASGIWYLDPEGLQTQFLPHLSSRDFNPFSGWAQPCTWKYSLPSQLTMLLVPLGLVVAMRSAFKGDDNSDLYRALAVAAVAIGLDAFGRMFYLSYYLVGLGPASLAFLARSRFAISFARLWCFLAILQIVIALKLVSPNLRTPISRSELREFLLAHTKPGDVIVVGPPFILSAASDPNPGGDRRIAHVVPMPLYLDGFDVNAWLNDIRTDATVYVGEPAYFNSVQLYYRQTSPPIFPDVKREISNYHGLEVLIARPVETKRK